MKKSWLPVLRFMVPLGLLGFVIYFWGGDYSEYVHYFSLPYLSLFFTVVFLIFLLNFFLVSFRLYISYKLFRFKIPYRTCLHATTRGQIGNFLPFIGQMIGQSYHTSKVHNIPHAVSSLIVLYERGMMFASGAFLCIVSAFYLFGKELSNSLPESQSLLDLALIFVICCIVTLVAVRKKDRSIFRKYFSSKKILTSLLLFSICLVNWLLVSSTFVIALKFMAIYVPLASLFGTSILVCFLASLPISVSGWGIREFAAVTLFGLLNIPQESALFISVSIGFLSLLALVASSLVTSFVKKTPSLLASPKKSPPRPQHMDRKIVYFLTCSAALLLFFQVHLSWNDITLNINLADPLALCGFFILISSQIPKMNSIPTRIPYTPFFLLLFTFLFVISLVTGIIYNGFSSFAVVNKFLGLFVLFGYASLGALFVMAQKNQGLKTITRIMTLVLCTIIFWRLSVSLLAIYHLLPPEFLSRGSLMGYASNRNAFCIQILSVLALLFAQSKFRNSLWSKKTYWGISFFLMALYLTFSRSGMITAIIFIVSLMGFKFIRPRNGFILMGHTALLILLIYAIDFIPHALSSSSFSSHSILSTYSGEGSDTERLYSWTQALKLWWHHPLFGIGLGSFNHLELCAHGRPLVIHNTFLWILAEFGISGFTGFMAYGFTWGVTLMKYFQQFSLVQLAPGIRLLLLILIISLPMALVHEIFYQRILWFIWGLALMGPISVHLTPLRQKSAQSPLNSLQEKW